MDRKHVDYICSQLMQIQRDRKRAIKMQRNINNSANAFIRNSLGFKVTLSEEERNAITETARKLRKHIERAEDIAAIEICGQTIYSNCLAVLAHTKEATIPWDRQRLASEQRMIEIAVQLPVWSWVKNFRGVTAKGLAVIVGEAGNLSNYPTWGHLLNALSIGFVKGKRQGAPGYEATPEDWIEHGYVPSQRGQIWEFLDFAMMFQQWQKGEIRGPYGAHYARKLAEYRSRGFPAPGRAARRYAAQRFIEDLWRAWRRTTQQPC
jgi:hypothetical protein